MIRRGRKNEWGLLKTCTIDALIGIERIECTLKKTCVQSDIITDICNEGFFFDESDRTKNLAKIQYMYISFCSFFFKRKFKLLLYTDPFVVVHANRCVPQICAIYTRYIHFKTTILGEMQNIKTQQMNEKVNVNMLYGHRSTLKNVAEGKNLISNESNANLSRYLYVVFTKKKKNDYKLLMQLS